MRFFKTLKSVVLKIFECKSIKLILYEGIIYVEKLNLNFYDHFFTFSFYYNRFYA